MPPKTPAKPKAQTPAKATPAKGAAKETTKRDTAKKNVLKKDSKDSTPTKTKKAAAVFTAVEKQKGAAIPIDVSFEGDVAEAKPLKNGQFSHKLKLEAAATFTILKTYTIQGGPDEGQQVIVLQPAKALAFKKFPREIRNRIYSYYLAPKGVVNHAITLDAKRKGTSDVYSKSYADGSKNRVALLAVDKEIHNEVVDMLYAMPIRFTNTTDLLDFIGNIKLEHKARLRDLEIKKYMKGSARIAFTFLADVPGLKRIRLETDVVTDDDPVKAAKTFWADASKLLEAVGARKEKETVKVAIKKAERDESDDEASESGESDGDDELEKLATKNAAASKTCANADGDGMDIGDDLFAKPTPTEPEESTTLGAGVIKSIEKLAAATKKTKKPAGPQYTERPGRKSDALNILQFGKKALQFKDEDKELCVYDDEMMEDFMEALKAKLK